MPQADDVSVVAHDAALDATAVDATAVVDAAVVADVSIDAPRAVSNPLPRALIFPVIALAVRGSQTQLTIGGGSKRGIRKEWGAFLIDDENRRAENGELVIEHVKENVTIATTSRLTSTFITEHYRRVRFDPR